MKTKGFFLAGLTALVLAGCAKEQTGGVDNNATKSYLTVELAVADPLSKTKTASDNRLDGTVAESSVSQAVVYLVQSGSVKAILSVNTLNQVAHSGYDDGYETAVMEASVGEGTYDVYVLTGSSSDPCGFSVDGAWDPAKVLEFAAASLNGVDNASNTAAVDNAFRMFNQHDASDHGKAVPTVTLTSANNTTANPAKSETVYLDRLTAKVVASASASFKVGDSIKSGDFASATATVDGTMPVTAATSMYMQQQWLDADMLQLTTPAPQTYYGFVNNLFTGAVSPYSQIETDSDGYVSVAVNDLSGKIIAAESPMYVLENAPVAPDTLWSNTTGLIFKVTLDAKGDGSNQTFFGYNKNSEHFLTLASLQAEYPNAFDVFGNKNADDTDDDAANLADAESLLASDVATFRAKTKINVFENGQMYYTHFIKDENYKVYGVYRNTWYQLSVEEIANFGDDIPGGWNPDDPTENPNPDTPVEEDKLYIKVKILVNKWVASPSTIILGQ